jgi:hypothetical protein
MFVLFTGDERIRQDKGQAGQDRSHCGRSLVRCIQVNLSSDQRIDCIETTFKLSIMTANGADRLDNYSNTNTVHKMEYMYHRGQNSK